MMPSTSSSQRPSYANVVASSTSNYIQAEQGSLSSLPSISTSTNIKQIGTSSSSSVSSISPLASANCENQTIVQKLGTTEVNQLKTERFQIDRRKLQAMITTPSSTEGFNSAECFFNTIQKITNTFIQWPRNLKIGAKCRRDPTVRVTGKPNDYTWAKGLILARLSQKGPLLKMKMTISHTEHAHIIGLRGSNVNRIMEETETHIHFPDSNRHNVGEKINQVALFGNIHGLERARQLLRLSAPLKIFFEIPNSRTMPWHDTPFIRTLEDNLNVKVIFRSTSKPNCYLVIVIGSEDNVNRVKQAVGMLINSTCDIMTNETMVNIELELEQQLYDVVAEEEKTVLRTIMANTQTNIKFSDPNGISRSSKMTITGSINGVYEAKQAVLANSLQPIELIFDITDFAKNTPKIMDLGFQYGICITMNPKQQDHSITTVTLKGLEKSIKTLYKIHQQILDMQFTAKTESGIPKAYYLQEPAFLRALENNISRDQSQYEGFSLGIWTPTDPNSVNNFLHVKPNTPPPEPGISPHLRQQEQARLSLSSESRDSIGSTNKKELASSIWFTMENTTEQTKNSQLKHVEHNLSMEDREVALIFMSAHMNASS